MLKISFVIPETAEQLSGIPFPLWGKVGWGLLVSPAGFRVAGPVDPCPE